ncbi:MAG TPA: hypothetical protein VFA85_10095 [Terriglobales bacterium]|nr:hypothetical protein [Terriglobales bacterium]
MTKLDRRGQAIVDAVKKFEETAHQIHTMEEQLQQETKKLHFESVAIRDRARTRGKKAQKRGAGDKYGTYRSKK